MRKPTAALAIAGTLAATLLAAPSSSSADEQPVYTFVSIPDFLNADVGDTRIRGGRGWEPGDPNSTNPTYERAVDVVLDAVEDEEPDAVFVAGDLVEGHWGKDADQTGIFGSVETVRRQRRAVWHAGNLYYGEWQRRFEPRGLTVYPAIGDHEIGDNNWPKSKQRLYRMYKKVWARHFTSDMGEGHRFSQRPVGSPYEDTSYAVQLTPELLLVTVDVFARPGGVVTPTVRGKHAQWLNSVLSQARADGVDRIIVQGHTPVLGPVRVARSSGLMFSGGADSRFWRILSRHNVDLYLAGEVHAVTAIDRPDQPTQIAHGGLFVAGDTNFLLGRVYADGRIELEVKAWAASGHNDKHAGDTLWQTSSKRQPEQVWYGRDTLQTVGRAVLEGSKLTQREGNLAPWDGQ